MIQRSVVIWSVDFDLDLSVSRLNQSKYFLVKLPYVMIWKNILMLLQYVRKIPYRRKKVREKWLGFSQVTNIFPRLNINPILFNPIRTFPTFFKTRRRTFPKFFKTLPNSLTRPHMILSNFKVHLGKIFLRKMFHEFGYLKLRISRNIFLNWSESRDFKLYELRNYLTKLTSYQGPKITLLVPK